MLRFDDAVEAAARSLLGGGKSAPEVRATDAEVAAARKRMERAEYSFALSPKAGDALRAYLDGRSVMLAGDPGTGKTMFFSSLAKSGVARHPIVIYSMSEHGNEYTSDIVDEMRGYVDAEVVVDDLGCESDWGGKRDWSEVLSRIVAVRERSRMRTHYTTNLTGAKIRKYDARLVSRLRTCAVFPFVGEDRRKAAPNTDDAAFLKKAASREAWILCEERCSLFKDGRCSAGRTVPPLAHDRTPQDECGVGARIPYADGYSKGEEELRKARRLAFVRAGRPDLARAQGLMDGGEAAP